MPLPDICIECDKMVNLLDWRGLCENCAEKEDEIELQEMCISKNGNKNASIRV